MLGAIVQNTRAFTTLFAIQQRTLMRGLIYSPTRKAFEISQQYPDQPHLQRYDALLSQTTNLIMRHGKKTHAAKLLSGSLEHLRQLAHTANIASTTLNNTSARVSGDSSTASATPHVHVKQTGFKAYEGTKSTSTEPSAVHLPSGVSPENLFADAVERCAPVVDTKSFKRGTKVMQIPRALTPRQRNRKAIMWILEAAAKRTSKRFEERVGVEIASVLAGTSEAVKKKDALYKLALASRSNVNVKMNI